MVFSGKTCPVSVYEQTTPSYAPVPYSCSSCPVTQLSSSVSSSGHDRVTAEPAWQCQPRHVFQYPDSGCSLPHRLSLFSPRLSSPLAPLAPLFLVLYFPDKRCAGWGARP
eukprot:2675164-Rhodomonas_salina.1